MHGYFPKKVAHAHPPYYWTLMCAPGYLWRGESLQYFDEVPWVDKLMTLEVEDTASFPLAISHLAP